MAISKRLRFEILRRDGHTCRYCGRSAPEVKLTVDHVVPSALGGTDDATNLVTACSECNAGKASGQAGDELVAEVKTEHNKWDAAVRTAAEMRAKFHEDNGPALTAFREKWNEWKILDNSGRRTKKTVYLPKDWEQALERYMSDGLPIEEMIRLVDVAMNARPRGYSEDRVFRYFMGCCKNVLAEIHATARKMLDTQPAEPTDDRPQALN